MYFNRKSVSKNQSKNQYSQAKDKQEGLEIEAILQSFGNHLEMVIKTILQKFIQLELQIAHFQQQFNRIQLALHAKVKHLGTLQALNHKFNKAEVKFEGQILTLKETYEKMYLRKSNDIIKTTISKIEQETQSIRGANSKWERIETLKQWIEQRRTSHEQKDKIHCFCFQIIEELIAIMCQKQDKVGSYLLSKIEQNLALKVKLAHLEVDSLFSDN